MGGGPGTIMSCQPKLRKPSKIQEIANGQFLVSINFEGIFEQHNFHHFAFTAILDFAHLFEHAGLHSAAKHDT